MRKRPDLPWWMIVAILAIAVIGWYLNYQYHKWVIRSAIQESREQSK